MAVALAAAALAGCQERPPPEAPAPAAQRPLGARPPELDNSALQKPVELREVRLRRPDAELERIFGPALPPGRRALVLEVQTREPLDGQARTSWPTILLNGAPLVETRRGAAADVLLGLVPDEGTLQERNTVEVAWVGNEDLTRTKTPLTFGRDALPPP